MFVTAWVGILEISTGTLTTANAGHEYPAFKKPGGEYELFKDKQAKEIIIEIDVVIPNSYAEAGVKTWTKVWRSEGLLSDNKKELHLPDYHHQ